MDPAVDLLPSLFAKGHHSALGFAVAAIEKTGDPDAASQLQALIPTAPDWALYWLTRSITHITGHHPAPPDRPRDFAEIRQIWHRLDLAEPPEPIVAWSRSTATRVEATVANGRGLFALAPDDTDGKGSWPVWDYSWRHAGERVYQVGCICDTCESWLLHVGWPPAGATELAQIVREQVADVQALDDATMTALEPLLCALASSRYQIRLIDLPLAVFQAPQDEQANLVIVPTQPPGLDPDTVERHEAAIARGRRPAVIVAAYVSQTQKYDYDEDTEQTLTSAKGFIIDGHHKLAAYRNQHVPPRTILICDRTPPLPTAADPIAVFDTLLA